MMDYGPNWPPPLPEPPNPPQRRRRRRHWEGFGLGTNIMILLGAVVICFVILKLADRPMQLDLKAPTPAAGTETAKPHHR